MNEEKRIKAEMLLESIGEIDDDMLDEALTYRKKPRVNVKALAIAASVALIFTVIAGSELINRFTDMSGDENEKPPASNAPTVDDVPSVDENSPSDNDACLTVESVFEALSQSDKYSHRYVTDPDTLPYLEGEVYIVWQYEGVEKYYISKPLSDRQLDTIKNALGKGKLTGTSSPTLRTRVWVLLGDGRVISPYLQGSQGNISSTIFDYEVEIIPNKAFAEKLQGILG